MMESLIIEYLSGHKVCALPGIGRLELQTQPAVFINGAQSIRAASAQIIFRPDPATMQTEGFIHFISREIKVEIEEAKKALEKFCITLKGLSGNAQISIPGAGSFRPNENGMLLFEQSTLQLPGFPDQNLQKIIRKQDVHAILVGDQEETNLSMQEQLNPEKPKKITYWYLTALVIFLISIVLLLFNEIKDNGVGYFHFGNRGALEIQTAPATYQQQP